MNSRSVSNKFSSGLILSLCLIRLSSSFLIGGVDQTSIVVGWIDFSTPGFCILYIVVRIRIYDCIGLIILIQEVNKKNKKNSNNFFFNFVASYK